MIIRLVHLCLKPNIILSRNLCNGLWYIDFIALKKTKLKYHNQLPLLVCKSLIKGWRIRLRIAWVVRNLLKIMNPPPSKIYFIYKINWFFSIPLQFCCVHFKQDVWWSVGDNFHFVVHLRVSYSSCNLSYYVGGPPDLLLWSQVSIIRNICS